MKLEGAITAMVTPMREGAIDEAGVGRFVRSQLDGGIEGLLVNGSTGEAATLTDDEQEYLLRLVIDRVGGAVPVIGGVGSKSTHGAVSQARRAQAAGADAVLVVCPAYNRPTQRGLVAHFRAVIDAVDLPVVLYNVPSRTVSDLQPEAVQELAEHPRVIGLKDATGDMKRAARTLRLVPDDFGIVSGDDHTSFAICTLGGTGSISVASNIVPRAIVDLIRAARSTDPAEQARGRALNLKLMPLFDALFVESNPIPVKAAARWLGFVPSDEMRLPLTALTEAGADVLAAAMDEFGLSFDRVPPHPPTLGPGQPLLHEARTKTVDLGERD